MGSQSLAKNEAFCSPVSQSEFDYRSFSSVPLRWTVVNWQGLYALKRIYG
jgi:hypothetical protein